MTDFDLALHPHRRRNALTGEWVSVAPHRTQRPWQGQSDDATPPAALPHDPACHLCPGNERASGVRNPDYPRTFVFDNDFASLRPEAVSPGAETHDLLRAVPNRGVCRVLCFSPRHDLAVPNMPPAALRSVVDLWADQTEELSARSFTREIFLFENRGAMMGASSPHPHGQIWATEAATNEMLRESAAQRDHLSHADRPLLAAYLDVELDREERIVCANEHFVVLVPFWAIWPFETLVLPRRARRTLPELDDPERDSLARILRDLTRGYDRVFEAPFPYSMGWHQAPFDGEEHPEWILHAHYYPPLLRSATVRKFMVGFEMLAEPLRDLTPEVAAARLRECVQSAQTSP